MNDKQVGPSGPRGMLSCLHTHTDFCDGRAGIQSMCEAAFAGGFVSLGFSSHAPITGKTGIQSSWHMADEKLDEYIDAVLAARGRWSGKLAVYLGMEVDYIEGFCGPADADIQALPLDFIIGAVHYAVSPKNGEIFNIDEFPDDFGNVLDMFDNDGMAVCNVYYDSYDSMIRAGGCDILAHLDIIKKNNDRYRFFSPKDTWYTKRLAATADLIAAARAGTETNGKHIPVVEVNTGGMARGYCSEPFPSLDILTLLKERDIPLVLNADAHSVDQLGSNYEKAMEKMVQAGYSAMVLFEGRKEGKAVWTPQTIP